MKKFEVLDLLLKENKGYIKTAEVIDAGISKPYFKAYIRDRELERAAHGLYMSREAWDDGMYVIQARYPENERSLGKIPT
jgi:hypothetical protein